MLPAPLSPVRLGRGAVRMGLGGYSHPLHTAIQAVYLPATGAWGGQPTPHHLGHVLCHHPTHRLYGFFASLRDLVCEAGTYRPSSVCRVGYPHYILTPWGYLKKRAYSTFERGFTKVLCLNMTITLFPSGSFYETMRLKGGVYD